VSFVEDGNVQKFFFDVISNDDDKTDASAAIRGFRLLRKQDFFKSIDKRNYVIWMDCGKHFRNYQMAGYLFLELKNLGIKGTI
jgi:hypothetical protein